jgi:hypothetical protein
MGQDDADIPRPVAIESDGTEQYRQMTVRERSRLRPQLLERLGWRYMPLWTIEVFTDPSACADRIGGYLGLEKPSPSGALRWEHRDSSWMTTSAPLRWATSSPSRGRRPSYENMDDRFGDELSRDVADESDADQRDAASSGADQTGTDRGDRDQTDIDQLEIDQTGTDHAAVDQSDHDTSGSDAAGAGVGFGSEAGLDGPATERKEGPL